MQQAKTSQSASWITKVILASLVFLSAITCFIDRPSSGDPYRHTKELATSAKGKKVVLVFRWTSNAPPVEVASSNRNQLSEIKRHTQLVSVRFRSIQMALGHRVILPGFSSRQIPKDFGQELPAHS